MRIYLVGLAAVLLAGCSDAPPEKKEPEPPPAAVTGRQAFQQTFGMARTWSTDVLPLRIRSINLPNPKSEDGKAGAWEIVYVSQSKARMRRYTWSAVEAEGNLHKGVWPGLEEGWSEHGQERPFLAAAIKVDTPAVLATAISKSSDYMKKANTKPLVNFMLESIPKFPSPVWRVFWGETVSGAEWSVFIDATTGLYAGR